jgi:fructokinase
MFELLGIGEVLWDLFPDGKRLGGAPFNLAYHARQLGLAAGSISRVGTDEWGREILERARSLGIPGELIQVDADLPTGTVQVELDEAGKPTFTITADVAWDAVELPENLAELLSGVKALAFGTLAQRSPRTRETIREILRQSDAPYKLYDINLRPPFYAEDTIRYSLEAATVLKLNDEELVTVSRMFGLPAEEAAACGALLHDFRLSLVCVTKGADGCSLHQPSGVFDVAGVTVEVADTVGSGDAFSAGLLVKLLAGETPETAAAFANAVGALVASKPGGTPPISPEELPQGSLNGES